MPALTEVVQNAWTEPSTHTNPYDILHSKLLLIGKSLKQWNRSIFSNAKIQFHMALDVILQLDLAMEIKNTIIARTKRYSFEA
jgi:hypothetical protein